MGTIILMAAALIPPLYLVRKIYDMDRIEKEPYKLLRRLFFLGALACLPAVLLEYLAEYLFVQLIPNGHFYLVVEVFAGVALVEEICKYFFLKKNTWQSPEFDYRFDGIVYAVFVSLGFAALENIMYVFEGGLSTAAVRAVLSIPGHCIFGIYMGYYYGLAKQQEYHGETDKSSRSRRMAVLVPTILHGIYDYLAFAMDVYSEGNEDTGFYLLILFVIFIIVLDVVTIRRVKRFAAEDERIAPGYDQRDIFSQENNFRGSDM